MSSGTTMRVILEEAVEYEKVAFDSDRAVHGGDLVEWFAKWRFRAELVLRRADLAAESNALRKSLTRLRQG
jgi:hypothetical protein